MAANVFGTPITNAYVEVMLDYSCKETLTQQDRAKVAMENKNAEGKNLAAIDFAKQLRSEFGKNRVSTMCLVYNATGNQITFRGGECCMGHFVHSHCPIIIANGQWGAFLYGASRGENCVQAAFVYGGKNFQGQDVDWVTAFDNNEGCDSQECAEIRAQTYYFSCGGKKENAWDELQDRVSDIDRTSSHCIVNNTEGTSMYACIGGKEASMLEAILTLPGVLEG